MRLRGRRTGVTAAELAERFQVTIRTVFRDLDSLRAASLPLNSERGRGGGIALDRSYSLPPVNFSAREAALLVAAGRWLLDMRVIPFGETLASGLDKVHAALSTSSQRQLLQHMDTLKFIGVPAHTAPPEVRRVREQAWFENSSLRIHYRGHSGLSSRRVRLQTIVMERSQTLLHCLDLEKNEPRQFRLERIERAELAS
ncbi:MAG TPA: HTH domain-containing protein [Polyangiales bacterium]|nr:HTH domain-containing protein [Polyangiales bacterium]